MVNESRVHNVDVLFLVVNYHSVGAVDGLLASIAARQGMVKIAVSVLDNSESGTEYAALCAVSDRYRNELAVVLCTRSVANLGYAGGNNEAYAAAEQSGIRARVVVVANPDVKIDGGTLSTLVDEVDLNPRALFGVSTRTEGELSNGLQGMDTRWGQARAAGTEGQPPRRSVVYPGGHFIVMSDSLWKAAGGFSDDFFLFCEEADLVLRLRRSAGFGGVRATESIVVDHDQGLTTGAHRSLKEKSLTTYFHGTRSRVILFRKHAELRRSLAFVITLRAAWAGLVLLRAGREPSGAVVRGMRSGLAWSRATAGATQNGGQR